jgi:NADH dehydrogenase/NADH:ubiquinone oxidoreductase subunit G
MRNDKECKEVSLYRDKTLDKGHSLNLVDMCPVGVVADEINVYQPAEWNLKETPSISTENSVCMNTYVLHKKNNFLESIGVKISMYMVFGFQIL